MQCHMHNQRFIIAGQKDEDVTFIFTDQDIINENFLEIMNSILATGEVVGLFQKDEKEAACNEVRNDFVTDYPQAEENTTNLYNYFLNRLRDNLHIVLFFSPLHQKFPIRAQMFPAVFSAVNINWFLPWPEEALVAVSANFLKSFKIDTTEENRNRLYELMASFQNGIRDVSTTYLSRMRKHVYVTPKSFLCFIEYYKKLYAAKYEDVNVQEKSVTWAWVQTLQALVVNNRNIQTRIINEDKPPSLSKQETPTYSSTKQFRQSGTTKSMSFQELNMYFLVCIQVNIGLRKLQEAANSISDMQKDIERQEPTG